MTKQTVSTFESAALKERSRAQGYLFFGFLALALFAASFIYSGFQIPSSWASKAGPVVTVFAILAVQKAQAMGDVLRPDGQSDGNDFHRAQEKFRKPAGRYMFIATWLAIAGAFIGVFGG